VHNYPSLWKTSGTGIIKSLAKSSFGLSSFNAIMENTLTLISKDEVLTWFDGKEEFYLFHKEMKHFEGDIYIDNN